MHRRSCAAIPHQRTAVAVSTGKVPDRCLFASPSCLRRSLTLRNCEQWSIARRDSGESSLPSTARAYPAIRVKGPSVERVLIIVGLAAVYFAAGKFGLSLAFVNASATAVWPPTGIALAALLFFGPRVWPGVLIGAFLVNLTTAGSVASSTGL